MQRIATPTASSNHKFLPGNGGTFRGTQFSAAWCNAVQEEICNLLEDNGFDLDADNNAQLSALFSNILGGHYAAQGHLETMDIGYFGISIPESEGYGIFIDSVNKKIDFNIDSESVRTTIDESGLTSGAGLFSVLGCTGNFAIGGTGMNFVPFDDNSDTTQSYLSFIGNFRIESESYSRNFAVFGNEEVAGSVTAHGRISGKIANNKFIKEYQSTLCQPWTINDFDGVPVDHGDVLFIRNSGDQTLYVEIYQGANVTIPPASGGAFMFRFERTTSGSVTSKILVPLFAADVSFS